MAQQLLPPPIANGLCNDKRGVYKHFMLEHFYAAAEMWRYLFHEVYCARYFSKEIHETASRWQKFKRLLVEEMTEMEADFRHIRKSLGQEPPGSAPRQKPFTVDNLDECAPNLLDYREVARDWVWKPFVKDLPDPEVDDVNRQLGGFNFNTRPARPSTSSGAASPFEVGSRNASPEPRVVAQA
ncbi:hypothetical protein JCM11641_008229 [Rhodosporidiobolus odoratus]